MSKSTGRIVSDILFNLVGLGMRPLYKQMGKERRLFDKRWDKVYRNAEEDARLDSMESIHNPSPNPGAYEKGLR